MHEVTESKKVEDAEAPLLYPSQAKEPECELDIEGVYISVVCEAKTKHELKYHEDEDHNWCWVCEKQFDTKRDFKGHYYKVHSSSKSIRE